MNRISTTLSALVLATAAHAAGAQGTAASGAPATAPTTSGSTAATATTATTGTTSPQAIGVSPQAASAAQQKAIPRSDTATVVRTGPSAADKATRASRQMSTDGKHTAGSARTAASGTTPTGDLPPRADRH